MWVSLMGVTLSPLPTYLKHCDMGYLYVVCHLMRWGVSRVIHRGDAYPIGDTRRATHSTMSSPIGGL